MNPTKAKIEIEYEDGHTVTATLEPEKAEKTLIAMKSGSIGRPLPEFKGILLSTTTQEPA